MMGLSTSGNISLGWALVAGRKRVPNPAAGKIALRTFIFILLSFSFPGFPRFVADDSCHVRPPCALCAPPSPGRARHACRGVSTVPESATCKEQDSLRAELAFAQG